MDRTHELYTEKPLFQDICVPGSAVRRSKQLPDLIICGLKFGPACPKQRRRRKRKNGQWRSQSSITLEDLEAFNFIDLGRWRDREAIKNARKNLEILMEAAMHCKTGTKKWLNKLRDTVSESDESSKNPKRQSMHASCKLMNPRESVWNPLHQKIMKITSQLKDTIR